MKKRIVSFFLAGILAFSCVPYGVEASETDPLADAAVDEAEEDEEIEALENEAGEKEEQEAEQEDAAPQAATERAMSSLLSGVKPADGTTQGQPFPETLFTDLHNNEDGYTRFRIPAITVTEDGAIVASCDLRWNKCDDGSGIDSIVSRSEDGGQTWNYSVVNYLGDNGNNRNNHSTAFIDTALATDGNTIWMACDIDPAGISMNSYHSAYEAKPGSTGFTGDGKLLLAKADGSVTGGSSSDSRAGANFQYHLEKVDEEGVCYRVMENGTGVIQQGYTIDEDFNITGADGTTTNLFCADSPFFPFPASYVYIKKSTDGGKSWSAPVLANVKNASEMALLIAPGRGIVIDHEGSKDGKRIIFAGYQFTSLNSQNSSLIYSDDGGATWTRGQTLSGLSSEVAITEADGRLYMFVRNQNKYSVSEDGGTTWSDLKPTGISYLDTCELSAVTYSKKIDGKTAILLSVPLGGTIQKPGDTGTTDRSKGRIYVGLVDAATGAIDWQSDPYFVTDGHYAYSSMAETKDGDIVLLYEHAERKITFEKIAIEDIAKDHYVGNVWLTDADGNVVSQTIAMQPGQTVSYTVNQPVSEETLTVTTSNKAALKVSYDAQTNTVVLKAGEDLSGLKRVKVMLTLGDSTSVLNVHVTDQEKYQLITLEENGSETITFKGNTYTDADVTNQKPEIAGVTVQTSYYKERPMAVFATGANAFGSAGADIHAFLYTLGGTDAENVFTVSSTNAVTPLYLKPNGKNGKVHDTSAVNVTFGQKEGAALFTLRAGSGAAEDDVRYLYFHRNGTHVFDRNSVIAENCYFELYTLAASEEEASNSPISGYRRISSLSELTAGMDLLIIPMADDNGDRYIPCATSGTENWKHVAKVTTNVITNDVAVSTATAAGVFDTANQKALNDCLYTFHQRETHAYQISNYLENGKKVYLNMDDPATIPNSTSAVSIYVASAPNGGVYLSGDASGRYLYFHKNDADKLYFNRHGNTSSANGCCELMLFEKAAGQTDSEIPGYAKVAFANIQNGGQYLIAAKAADGTYYVLSPSADETHAYAHVARVEKETNYTGAGMTPVSKVTFTAAAQGNTTVQIADTVYYVIVKKDGAEAACRHETTLTMDAFKATCGKAGSTGDQVCVECGTVVTPGSTIEPTGEHTYGEWQIEKEPTLTESGLKYRICGECSHREEVVLDRLTETVTPGGDEKNDPDQTPGDDRDEPVQDEPIELVPGVEGDAQAPLRKWKTGDSELEFQGSFAAQEKIVRVYLEVGRWLTENEDYIIIGGQGAKARTLFRAAQTQEMSVQLTKKFLNTLASGNYTLHIVTTDFDKEISNGIYSANFEVAVSANTSNNGGTDNGGGSSNNGGTNNGSGSSGGGSSTSGSTSTPTHVETVVVQTGTAAETVTTATGVKTGDASHTFVWTTLLAACAAAFVILQKKKETEA